MISETASFEPLYERLSASPDDETNTGTTSKKRKHIDESQVSNKKKAKAKKRKRDDDDELNIELGINRAFAAMDSQLMSDYIGQRLRKVGKDLSSIELEDMYISSNMITDTTTFETERTINNLPAFLEKFSPNPTKLWSSSKKNGAPHTIIVTGAGLRAADLARVIRKYQTKDAAVAKLFAKHIKMADAVKFLKTNKTGMAVGTPKRLSDLMDDGALSIERLERIVVDVSHIDQKKRGILDMVETQTPLVQWLHREELKTRYEEGSGGIDLLFF